MEEKEILDALNNITLDIAGWEASENIMTFNGMPIGATISRQSRLEMDRWWPALKREIARHLTSQPAAQADAKHKRTCLTCGADMGDLAFCKNCHGNHTA